MAESEQVDFAARREADLDRLADSVEASLDWQKMDALLMAHRLV
jgi:adenosylcobyric acid synthase